MKNVLEFLNGKKSYIGAVIATVIALVVSWSETDSITWDTPWITTLTTLCLGIFGVGIAHKGAKIESAIKKNG